MAEQDGKKKKAEPKPEIHPKYQAVIGRDWEIKELTDKEKDSHPPPQVELEINAEKKNMTWRIHLPTNRTISLAMFLLTCITMVVAFYNKVTVAVVVNSVLIAGLSLVAFFWGEESMRTHAKKSEASQRESGSAPGGVGDEHGRSQAPGFT